MLRQILFFSVVLTVLVTSHGATSSPNKPKVITTVDELSLQERLVLSFLKKADPRYKNLPDEVVKPPTIIKPLDTYTMVDYHFDLASILLKSYQWQDSLPEVNWRFGISFCFELPGWAFCMDQAWTFSSSDSKLLGADTISMKTDWTKDSFALNYTIGNFTWYSPNATILDEDFIEGGSGKCQGAFLTIQNLTMLIEADYTFDNELGIQLDMPRINFTIGNNSYGYGNCVFREFGGEEKEYEGYTIDATESQRQMFEDLGSVFGYYLMARMNCFFSDGKYVAPPPEEYGDYEDWEFSCFYDMDKGRHYGQSSALQFLQTMVMGRIHS